MSAHTTIPDIALRLYGETRAPSPDPHVVTVGGLSFIVEGMALRWICRDGVELLRSVAFVVRDTDWGTYSPAVQMDDKSSEGHIQLSLTADIDAGTGRLLCRIAIEATGTDLTATAEATASGDFSTNRAGFVVLHPAACAGEPVRVGHADGTITQGLFPRLISPHQPFLSMQMIEHRPAAGVIVQTRFEGEQFEMEDQRNWSDASFKTYSRPLALPFPYVIGNGETVRQTVRLRIAGSRTAGDRVRSSHDPVHVQLMEGTAGRLPMLAIGGRPQDYVGSDVARARLAALRPPLLLVELDAPGAGAVDIRALRALQDATGARLALMLRRGGEEMAALTASGVAPEAVALVGANASLVEAARRIFPNARIGAGTDAFFTEFNRKPPIPADFVFWTVNPTVHADDDASIMETLSVLIDQAATARAHCPGTKLWCGPVTLRMRFNPNASTPDATPGQGVPPPDVDARQRGLFGAAFTLGQIAAWATAGIDTLVLHAPFGPRGVIHAQAAFPMPWYDGQADGVVYPSYQVLAGLTRWSGTELRLVKNSAPERITAIAVQDSLWLANLGPAPITVAAPGELCRMLDEQTFAEAVREPEGFWDRGMDRIVGGAVRLAPFAIARLTGHDN